FQRGVFEFVNGLFLHRRETGLEGGEPVVRLPVESDGSERAPGKFRERVMRNAFAAVEKKRNAVAMKGAFQRLMIAVKVADEHGAVPETVSGAHKFHDFARRKSCFGPGVRTSDDANGVFWILDSGFWILIGMRPALLQTLQRRIFCEA